MDCTVIRGYFDRVLIEAPPYSGIFEPGRRTLTGARHRNGDLRCMTASMVVEYLGIDRASLKRPGDSVVVDSKGIFDPITPVDISMHTRLIFNVVSQPVRVLMGACALESRNPKNKE